MKTKFALFALFLSTLFLFGCGNNNPLGVVRVTGTVTLDGQPAEGVTVLFVPTSAEGRTASGISDSNGRFSLTAAGADFGAGAIPGEYIPTFSKTEMEGTGLSEEEFARRFPGDSANLIHLIPQRYASSRTSGFEAVNVERGGRNQFAFELTSE